MKMATQTQEKKRKTAAQTGLYLVVLAAIAILANLIVSGMSVRSDWTKTERYTLSQGSARLVKNLNDPIHVDAYVTTGLARLDAFVRDLTDLLKEYQRASNGKFNFTIIRADSEELREQAKEEGLQEMAFGEASASGEDQASIAQGFMGLVFKYGSEKDVIPQLHPSRTEGMEFWITNKIREIRDKAEDIKHRIGVVSGKDELKLTDANLVPKQGRQGSPSLQQILTQAFPFYTFEDVELSGDKEIDPELRGLIITQPRKDYTVDELRRVDQFLMLGDKALVVYASAVTFKPQDATMQASLDLHNLDELLSGYGIAMKKNAILDFGASLRIPVITQVGTISAIRHPGILHLYNDPRLEEGEKLIDVGFAGFFRMDEVALPFASSLELLRDKQPADVELKAVARSSLSAAVLTDETLDMAMKTEWTPKPPLEQRVVAAVATGKLKSAFEKSESIKANERAPKPSRVFVLASSLFLTNPFAYLGNGQEMGGQFQMMGAIGGDRNLQMIAQPYAQRYLTNTILSLKNTLDWMTGDSDLIAASAKILSEPNLTYGSLEPPEVSPEDDEAEIRRKDEEYRAKRKVVQNKVQWSLTIGMPIAFALIGLGRWRRRESLRSRRAAAVPKKRA